MADRLNVGLIGCGGMGSGHAVALASGTGRTQWYTKDHLKTLDEIRAEGTPPGATDISGLIGLKGIVDISPARREWAEKTGIYVYNDYEQMLADPQIDIVLIATPNHLHKDMAIRAMKAGKHVLCEKPVTPSSAELTEVMKTARETGRVFYPRQNRRWDHDFLIAKKIFDTGAIGEIFSIECRVMGSRGIPGDWRGVKAFGGGMLLDWGVHLIDRVLMMVPEKVRRVFCHQTHVTNRECDDNFEVKLFFDSGRVCTLEVGTCHFIPHPLWYLAGTRGTAVIENWNCEGRIVTPTVWKEEDAQPIVAGEGLTKTMAPRGAGNVLTSPLPEVHYDANELYANLARTVLGEEKPLITPEQALRVIRLMEAAQQSADTGECVVFEA